MLCALASYADPAAAQDADPPEDEIVVTATKRATAAQDVPFSLNVQTEAGEFSQFEMSRGQLAGLILDGVRMLVAVPPSGRQS